MAASELTVRRCGRGGTVGVGPVTSRSRPGPGPDPVLRVCRTESVGHHDPRSSSAQVVSHGLTRRLGVRAELAAASGPRPLAQPRAVTDLRGCHESDTRPGWPEGSPGNDSKPADSLALPPAALSRALRRRTRDIRVSGSVTESPEAAGHSHFNFQLTITQFHNDFTSRPTSP